MLFTNFLHKCCFVMHLEFGYSVFKQCIWLARFVNYIFYAIISQFSYLQLLRQTYMFTILKYPLEIGN